MWPSMLWDGRKELIERGWDGQFKGPVIIGSAMKINSKELFERYPIINTGTIIYIELTETRKKSWNRTRIKKWTLRVMKD